jgi:hypothetical protein
MRPTRTDIRYAANAGAPVISVQTVHRALPRRLSTNTTREGIVHVLQEVHSRICQHRQAIDLTDGSWISQWSPETVFLSLESLCTAPVIEDPKLSDIEKRNGERNS